MERNIYSIKNVKKYVLNVKLKQQACLKQQDFFNDPRPMA